MPVYFLKQSNGKLTAVFGGGSAAVLRGLLSKNLAPLTYLSANLSPAKVLSTLSLSNFSISLTLLKREGAIFAPSDSTAMCLYIPLALPLALSSSFVCSYPLASQSTLNCPQPSLSFNLSLTLLFVPPLSTSQLSAILHSLHCRQMLR
jgi:hypothetical protein